MTEATHAPMHPCNDPQTLNAALRLAAWEESYNKEGGWWIVDKLVINVLPLKRVCQKPPSMVQRSVKSSRVVPSVENITESWHASGQDLAIGRQWLARWGGACRGRV